MGNLKLVCDKCKYEIASISKDICVPVFGAMFLSKDEKHGFPPPWPPITNQLDMSCPMCHYRPFPMMDRGFFSLLTNLGPAIISKDGIGIELAEGEEIPPLTFIDEVPEDEEDIQSESDNDDSDLSESEPEEASKDEEVVGAFDLPDLPEVNIPDLPEVNIPHPPEVDLPDVSGIVIPGPPVPNVPPMPGDSPFDSAIPTFEGLLKEGIITQHGSWFEYEGKKYRKAELEDILNG